MSKAIKCDRCGKYCEEHKAYKICGNVLVKIAGEFDCSQNFDLCNDCGISLNNGLRDWWRNIKKSSHVNTGTNGAD